MTKLRKGFTLVEMVIVLAFSVTLSTAITFMNRNAESSAQASRIVNRLKSARTAALMRQNYGAEVRYFEGCMIVRTEDGVYAGYELDDNARLREKLTAKAEAANLLGSDMKSPYNNGGQVWVMVLPAEG